jgi:3-deoxy-7-phosphoheptulonate synthase
MYLGIRKTHGRNQIDDLLKWIEGQGLGVRLSESDNTKIIGLIGDTANIDMDLLLSFDIVESINRIQEPCMNAHPRFHSLDSVIDVYDQNF